MIRRFPFLIGVILLHVVAADSAMGEGNEVQIPASMQTLFTRHCGDCHDADGSEASVVVAGVSALDLETLNRAQDQIFFGLMPPDVEQASTDPELRELADWIRGQLRARNSSALDEKLRYPAYGNYVDHDSLFAQQSDAKSFTPARRWLVSPEIFHERVVDVFKLEDQDRREKVRRGFVGVTNPFLLPTHSGVRYFDNVALDGGHLQVMLGNADWISRRQILIARHLNGDRRKVQFENPKDRWLPRQWPQSYRVFQDVIESSTLPNEDLLRAAIVEQFDCVLHREPTLTEQGRYLGLLKESIALSDNEQGLRQMLFAVLMESEFVYRLEFGGEIEDEFGRRKLTSREASYAISYALGDRGPDDQLVKAATEDRLQTREDYEREVRRLLRDADYYRGQVDSSLNGKHYQSNETSHPRLVRFFRDFFGYANSLRVFKDSGRSDGKYQNPGRGSQATPGWLTLEADRILTWHLERDEHVFENMLTSDKFFVYHNRGNEEEAKIITEWREVYEKLKDENWKEKPETVLVEYLEFLERFPSLRIRDASRPGELVNLMHYFEESFGEGRTPFTTVPWAHGYTLHHSVFYSLPPTPAIGRYGSWKSTKYRTDVEPLEFWDYPTEQPFAIENRKGILTHPAWLIAHSSNFHSDPIRRGRWIREKLLAGRVPDVPITVDAQVPEDPHHTFRERVEQVTSPSECWKCHQHMNPLGFAFEMYDDFGRYRSEEILEHPDNLLQSGNGKTSFDVYPATPVNTRGALSGSGEVDLDGEVQDALELIDRLAQSDRVRQSIIRHAFRFFMGRNEMPSDAPTLIAADRAYVESGGSFQEVVVALLTSDSFIYRKNMKD